MVEKIRELKNTVSNLTDYDYWEDRNIVEVSAGVALIFIEVILALFVGAILIMTFPIWGLPYLIYKTRK